MQLRVEADERSYSPVKVRSLPIYSNDAHYSVRRLARDDTRPFDHHTTRSDAYPIRH